MGMTTVGVSEARRLQMSGSGMNANLFTKESRWA